MGCAVYSFGIILWELLTWRVPWEDYEGPWQVVPLPVPQLASPCFCDLLQGTEWCALCFPSCMLDQIHVNATFVASKQG